jgi:hypothetical protein
MALRAFAVRADRSSVLAHDSWLAMLAMMDRWFDGDAGKADPLGFCSQGPFEGESFLSLAQPG